jgi:SAM-dependent methyltransferase
MESYIVIGDSLALVKPERKGPLYIISMTLYESLAPLYDGLFPVDSRASPFLDALVIGEGRSRGLRALDAGCATGAHALGLAALGWTVVGIDSEPAMIGVARERARREGLTERVTFFEADILEIEERFGNGSFDLVLCLGNTLPHLGASGAASFLAQARRALAPGGALVLQTLNFSLPGIGLGYAFPEIAAGGAALRRSYRTPPGDHPASLRFIVELESEGRSQVGETLLTPLGPRRIGSLLGDAGFEPPIRRSGWDGRPFDEGRDLYCVTIAFMP